MNSDTDFQRRIDRLEQALKIIHTWAACDYMSRESREDAMRHIADKANEALYADRDKPKKKPKSKQIWRIRMIAEDKPEGVIFGYHVDKKAGEEWFRDRTFTQRADAQKYILMQTRPTDGIEETVVSEFDAEGNLMGNSQ